jgi:hypothetical protein
VHELARPIVHKREGSRDDGVIRRIERDLLCERHPQDHPRRGIVGQRAFRCAVDQCIEVRNPAKHFAGNGNGESWIGSAKTSRSRRRIELQPKAKHGM